MSEAILPHAASARYGLLGLPLAFVALPLYVMLPAHYAQLGVPLSLLGLVLLGTRLFDAVIDPLLGRWVDAGWSRPWALKALIWASFVLGLGFVALFFPPMQGSTSLLLWWCAVALVGTFTAFSLASVLHQAWGSRLGGSAVQRARLVAWREGLGLVGVLLANAVATQAGMAATTAVLWTSLALGVWALSAAPVPRQSLASEVRPHAPLTLPWRDQAFRRLMALFMLNGIANAIPATLVLFFIQDRIQAPAWTPVFLSTYFAMGAASVPIWLALIRRLGPSMAWAWGMALHVLGFVGVLAVGAGDTLAYLAVCVASGLALGADLTVPGTLLTGVIQRAGHGGQEGAYAGWWQLASKLNLALAAGLALPALQWLGYGPGARDPQALQALSLAYGALPCLFKCLALALWWRLWRGLHLE